MNKKYQADMKIIFELLYEARDLISRGLGNIRKAVRILTDLLDNMLHDSLSSGLPPYPQAFVPPQKKDGDI